MSSTKLIRHGMDRVAPPPEGTTQELIYDKALILALLIAKGTEELQEVAQAPNRQELLRELGDVYEVLHSIGVMHGWSMESIRMAATRKAEERGPLLVESASHDGPCAVLHKVHWL